MKQAAVRRYGAGSIADRAAVHAMRRFFKWLAKHPPERTPATVKPLDRVILPSPARPR